MFSTCFCQDTRFTGIKKAEHDKERVSFIVASNYMLLLLQMGTVYVRAAVACSIFQLRLEAIDWDNRSKK